MELRQFSRYRVEYRSSFSSRELVEGEGVLVDLSARGCRISTETSVAMGTVLVLRVHLADREWPAEIAVAQVHWAAETEFGVEFLHMSGEAAERVHRVVRSLEEDQAAH